MEQNFSTRRFLERALAEDLGAGDITTDAIVDTGRTARAHAQAKSRLVVAGLGIFGGAFRCLDPGMRFTASVNDGQLVLPGEKMVSLEGNLRAILSAERVALNLLQRLSGIATLTRAFVEAVAGTKVKILDTRKTTPGLRRLEKYAVTVGGGFNHRFGLDDGILIKDNHIRAAGGIARAVELVRRKAPHLLKIEIEVRNLAELQQAVAAGVEVVMLDNMSIDAIREAVTHVAGGLLLEASGNITLANVREVAATGVDFISIGALTHSAPAADISLAVG